MTEIAFYHLEREALEQALPRLLEKALAKGYRVVVRAGSEERVEALNTALWTYAQDSFLPHGSARDGNGAEQPIWLTAGDDVPNGATLLVLVDGASEEAPERFPRCAELFDGRDDTALATARAHWAAYAKAGYSLTYWRQTEAGAWREQQLS